MTQTNRFTPLTPRIGAKCTIRREEILDLASADEIMDALERYGVLVFPEIGLDDEELVAFTGNLGEIMPIGGHRPDGTRDPVYKITVDPRVNPTGAEYIKNTIDWHIDGLWEDGPPPKASLLSARRLSATGGETEFASTYSAYDDLSERDKEYYESLRIVHSLEASRHTARPKLGPEEEAKWREAQARRERAGRVGRREYPLVRHHRSGRKSLILGPDAHARPGRGHAARESPGRCSLELRSSRRSPTGRA